MMLLYSLVGLGGMLLYSLVGEVVCCCTHSLVSWHDVVVLTRW